MRIFPGILAPLAIILPLAISHISPPQPEPDTSAVLIKLIQGHGSGVHIGGGYILTAKHVIEGAETVEIEERSGKVSRATVLWAHGVEDIGLVHTNHYENMAVADLACRDAIIGEVIYAIGNPLMRKFVMTKGTIGGPAEPLAETKETLLTADITLAPGMSGGPIFSADGKVIGFTKAFFTASPGLALIVPATIACRMLAMPVR
jgi:S1-C subfamily serine protease